MSIYPQSLSSETKYSEPCKPLENSRDTLTTPSDSTQDKVEEFPEPLVQSKGVHNFLVGLRDGDFYIVDI